MIQKSSIILSIFIVGMILFVSVDVDNLLFQSFSPSNGDIDHNPPFSDTKSDSSKDESTLSIEEQIMLLEKKQEIEIQKVKNQIQLQELESRNTNNMIKIGVSLLFLIVCLFVILSKKYDDETKKWAFSMLTMIGGVWVGTIV
ncbi:hypothetical protein [Kordia sp.]|uniref:hypothetical protein n=1 Tax=Kordia sp. TaxID=1965332 RepID=UPI003D26BFE3